MNETRDRSKIMKHELIRGFDGNTRVGQRSIGSHSDVTRHGHSQAVRRLESTLSFWVGWDRMKYIFAVSSPCFCPIEAGVSYDIE